MRSGITLAAALSALALAACETPRHSNTLIFGTNTKVAFDVSSDQITQTPSLTLGYARQEGVWMPLMPNVADQQGTLIPCEGGITTTTLSDGTRIVNAETGGAGDSCSKFVGKNGSHDEDTYSVLASFGADFAGGAGADASGGEARGAAGIAQYFATGMAARKLAEAGSRLVSVQPTDEELFEGLKQAQQERLGISNQELMRFEKEQAGLVAQFMAKCAPGGSVNQAACNAMADKAAQSNANPGGASAQVVQLMKLRIQSGNTEAVRSEISKWELAHIAAAIS